LRWMRCGMPIRHSGRRCCCAGLCSESAHCWRAAQRPTAGNLSLPRNGFSALGSCCVTSTNGGRRISAP
jgi:hypothetical protein